MKKYILTSCLLVGLIGSLQCQEIYFKPNLRFHLPLSYQRSPEYFEAGKPYPGAPNIPLSTMVEKFSLAKGFSFGGSLGYVINDKLRTEIGLSYFKSKRAFKGKNSLETDWVFKTFNIVPTLVLDKHLGKSTFSAKAGPVFGISRLEKSINYSSISDREMTYEFNRRLSFGYLLGLEYQYPINSNMSFTAECGVENYFYTPTSGKLINHHYNDDLRGYEIKYEKEITGENGYYSFENDEIYIVSDGRTKRLKETLKMNSVYLGIGLTYKLRRNEEN